MSGSNPTRSVTTQAAPIGPAWFQEEAKASGLDFVHRSGANPEQLYFPEIVCGGVGLIDYDGDGQLDVYLVQGGERISQTEDRVDPNRLYRNLGEGRFKDVTQETRTGHTGYGMGCAVADYDADGDPDLYVTNAGANVLYRNDAGVFRDVTDSAGVGDPGLSSSAAFFDYDQDGDLDLYVVNYVRWSVDSEIDCGSNQGPDYCQPNNYQSPAPDTLYRNNGDGTFTDVSVQAGIRKAFGNGLGVATGDFNGDGQLDIFVANDSDPNQHWIQGADGRFEDEALVQGTSVNLNGTPEAGMGVAAIDYDQDGDLDLFLSHLRAETNTFYLNVGTYFRDDSDALGLGASSRAYTGFGLGFADLNLDGRLDLFVANGKVMRHEETGQKDIYAEANLLYEGVEQGLRALKAEEITSPVLIATSRGAGFGDLDNDGDIDIVVVNRDHPVHLLRNQSRERDLGHGIILDIRDEQGLVAHHAIVRVYVGDRRFTRRVEPHYSYCSSNDPRLHFGLGSAEQIDSYEIEFRDGTTASGGPLAADRVHVVGP